MAVKERKRRRRGKTSEAMVSVTVFWSRERQDFILFWE